jgi:hypothetical protein
VGWGATLLRRRDFIASAAAVTATTGVSNVRGLSSLRSSKGRPFDWRDADNRASANVLAISPDGAKFALQVTRPLSDGPPYYADSTEPRGNLDLRGELWLLGASLKSGERISLGGRGVWSPSFSPDGRHLAALTLTGPGRVGLVLWDLRTGKSRLILNYNVEIYFTTFRTAWSAYATPGGVFAVPYRYVWIDATSILFVDHGPDPQEFFLRATEQTSTLAAFRQRTIAGQESARVWNGESATCGAGGRLIRLACDTGDAQVIYDGDIRGVSVSPDTRSAALLVATSSLAPIPNAPVQAPLGLTEIDEPMVRMKLTLSGLTSGATPADVAGVTAVGAVPPGRLPVWTEDSARVVVPVRESYSDSRATGDDAAWEVTRGTHEARRWPAHSALDSELLTALLSTHGLNNEAVLNRRPIAVTPGDYWMGQVRGGAWRCSPSHVLFWNSPALMLIGPDRMAAVAGDFTAVQPPVNGDGVSRTLALGSSGETSVVSAWNDRWDVQSLRTGRDWTLMGVRSVDAMTVYKEDSSTGTFLWRTQPARRPRASRLRFNTYFRDVLRPQRTMLTCLFPDGSRRRGVLQLPTGHKQGERHGVIVFAYPNFAASLDSSITQGNNAINVTYPIQYLLAKGFAFFHAPFPISGNASKHPMRSAVEAVLPWLDVLDRRAEVIPGEYGFWGQSNAGYVALALEAMTHRFKAIVAWATFPEIGYGDLHSDAFVVGLNCAGNIIQSWRGSTEDPGAPYTPEPTLPWTNPARYIRNDPLFNLDRSSTPLLLLEGEFDSSPREMEEVYSILRARGVPVELTYYWGEGHNFASPGNIRDSWRRTEDFFRKYLRLVEK